MVHQVQNRIKEHPAKNHPMVNRSQNPMVNRVQNRIDCTARTSVCLSIILPHATGVHVYADVDSCHCINAHINSNKCVCTFFIQRSSQTMPAGDIPSRIRNIFPIYLAIRKVPRYTIRRVRNRHRYLRLLTFRRNSRMRWRHWPLSKKRHQNCIRKPSTNSAPTTKARVERRVSSIS